jgi:Putative restriction endonuclease
MPDSDVELKRWKRVEYEQLVERGVFATGERVELIDGLLIVAEPQSATHYTAIKLVERALSRAFGEGWHTRSQAAIALDETSEPEPDVAVVRGDLRAYTVAHPDDPVLVVEVALTSLALDREHKGASTPARAARSTGSSTWSTACSRSIAIPRRQRARPTGGTTGRGRLSAPVTAFARSQRQPRESSSAISSREAREGLPARGIVDRATGRTRYRT